MNEAYIVYLEHSDGSEKLDSIWSEIGLAKNRVKKLVELGYEARYDLMFIDSPDTFVEV